MRLNELVLLVDLEQCKAIYSDRIQYEFNEFILKGGYSNNEAYATLVASFKKSIKEVIEVEKWFKAQQCTTRQARLEIAYHLRRLKYIQQWNNSYLKLLEKNKPA